MIKPILVISIISLAAGCSQEVKPANTQKTQTLQNPSNGSKNTDDGIKQDIKKKDDEVVQVTPIPNPSPAIPSDGGEIETPEVNPADEGLAHDHNDKDLTGAVGIKRYRQLFLDAFLIEGYQDVVGSMHQGEKQGAVIPLDKPWESSGTWFPGTVLYDKSEKIFKMWYMSNSVYNGTPSSLTSYATSTDGINWTKPNLGILDYNGNKNNNLFSGGNMSVYIDDEAPANERYKGFARYHDTKKGGGFVSSDGVRWTKTVSYDQEVGDISSMVYDANKKEYLIALKGNLKDNLGYNTRKLYNITSKDLKTYGSLARMDTTADATDANGFERAATYGIGIFPYQDIYIGFNWLFQITELQGSGQQDGYIHVDLMTKRGSFTNQWTRPSRDPIIPRGKAGDWDAGMVTTSTTPLVVGNEIWLYYSGFPKSHTAENNVARIGLVKWRLDGFRSVDAAESEGTFTTKLIHFEGSQLFLNANIKENGYIKIELLDRNNQVIGEYNAENVNELKGDSLNHLVKWKDSSNLKSFEAHAIKLRFKLKNSELYSYYFK